MPENCDLTAETARNSTNSDQQDIQDQVNGEQQRDEKDKDATDYFQQPYEPGELYQNQLADPENMWHLRLESENSGDELPDL